MHAITTLLLMAPIVLAITTANAGFTAWSGDACNGAVGLDVPCTGGCGNFDGRHSFLVRYPIYVSYQSTELHRPIGGSREWSSLRDTIRVFWVSKRRNQVFLR